MHSRPLDEKYPRKAGVIFAPGILRHALCARPIAWALLGCTTLIAHRAQGDTQAASAPATASVPAPAGTSDETSLSDIIVTATRRAERLQDVPIAISAFSGSQVEQAQIESSADLQYLVPSLKYQPFGANGSPAFFIRGVGTQTYDLAVERSVGAVLDDVPQLLPRIDFMASLVDLDQVEVLRGPQGTLFGKNSTAGVVSISTKRPELGVFSNEAQIDYGKFDQARFHDIVNIPVGDNIAIRLRASYKTEDAASYNVYISRRDNPDVDYNVNAKILWAPTDNLRVLLEADYQKDFQTTGTGAVPRTQNAQDNPQKFPISYYDGLYGIVGSFVPENVDYLNEIAVQQPWGESPFFAANISYQFGDYSLTSITGYRYVYWNDNIYYDDLPLRYLAFNHNIYDASQVTQEIRLASPSGRRIEYVVGAFFSRFDGSYTDYAGGTAGLLPNSDPIDLSLSPGPGKKLETVVSKSYAVFADVTGHVTDKFQLRLGGRETKDSQSANIITSQVPGLCQITYAFGAPCYPDPGPAPEAGSINHTDWSGRFTAQYDFTEDISSVRTLLEQIHLVGRIGVVLTQAKLRKQHIQRGLLKHGQAQYL